MKNTFVLSANTQLKTCGIYGVAVNNAINIFKRDINNSFSTSFNSVSNHIIISIDMDYSLQPEQFKIIFPFNSELEIQAIDELGIIFGLLYISETYMDIAPFWFWNNQIFEKRDSVDIPAKTYVSEMPRFRFRGWFVNDEVLLKEWNLNGNNEEVWRMVFETLLRCKGNMIIPGTDLNNKVNRNLAANMGIWITHHHAEPLGTEMFSRVYPDKTASYLQNKQLFEKLWEDSVIAAKDMKVIWNLGYSSQGNAMFWEYDNSDIPFEEWGKIISDIIAKQAEIVKKHVKDPVFCTYLYSDIMEVYSKAGIYYPKDVIKIWGDNGYGKMVSRRHFNHNPRFYSLPRSKSGGNDGVFYHVTFYDLQASNHLTMSQNSIDFMNEELTKCLKLETDRLFLVNCGNIKPHVYTLDFIREFWTNGTVNVEEHLTSFVRRYFNNRTDEICECIREYFKCTIQYGNNPDEKCGEQFYHYTARHIISALLKNNTEESIEQLLWATGDIGFYKQVEFFKELCESSIDKWSDLLQKCENLISKLEDNDAQLFYESLMLQVIIHFSGCKGGINLAKCCEYLNKEDYLSAFVAASDSILYFEESLTGIDKAEHGNWAGFYENDCLTNIKLTVYFCDSLRRYIRIIGEGSDFYSWQRKEIFPNSEKNVILQTNFKNHLSDNKLAAELRLRKITSK